MITSTSYTANCAASEFRSNCDLHSERENHHHVCLCFCSKLSTKFGVTAPQGTFDGHLAMFSPESSRGNLNRCQTCASVSCRPGWVWLGLLREACCLHFGNGLSIRIAALHPCGPCCLLCNAVCRNECISKLDEFFSIIFFCSSRSIDSVAMAPELDLACAGQCQ